MAAPLRRAPRPACARAGALWRTSARLLLTAVTSLSPIIGACVIGARALIAQAPWRLVEEVRIGNGESEAYTFTDIRGLAVGTNGRIFVLDYKTQEIRAFDSTGKFIKVIARRGHGPGEISNANGLGQAPDGTIWVNDPGNSRFTLFRPDGSFLRQHVVPIRGYGFIWDGMVDAEGRINDPLIGPDPKGRHIRRLRRYAADGTPGDTVDVPCTPPGTASAPWIGRSKNGGSGSMTIPFTPRTQVALDPRGYAWCSTGEAYRVVRVRLGKGDTVAVIHRDVAPVPVTASERATEIARADSFFKRYETSNVDYSQIPKVKPVIQALDVDDAGRLWARRTTASRSSTTFDLFDTNGSPIATVTGPFRISAFWHPVIRGDAMYTVVVDEDDVPMVVRARTTR